MTQTTNIGLKKIDGSENWRQIFDYHNDSMDKADSSVAAVQDGLAIVANGNTHASVAEGQFVYVRNHSTLAEGLYKATETIATDGELTASNLAADTAGGLNDLKSQVDSLNSNKTDFEVGVFTPVFPRDTVSNLYGVWLRIGRILFITAQWTNVHGSGASYIDISSLPTPTGYRQNYGFHGNWMSNTTDKQGIVGQYSETTSMRFEYAGNAASLPDEPISMNAWCLLIHN